MDPAEYEDCDRSPSDTSNTDDDIWAEAVDPADYTGSISESSRLPVTLAADSDIPTETSSPASQQRDQFEQNNFINIYNNDNTTTNNTTTNNTITNNINNITTNNGHTPTNNPTTNISNNNPTNIINNPN